MSQPDTARALAEHYIVVEGARARWGMVDLELNVVRKGQC